MKLMLCYRCMDVKKFQIPGYEIWCECKRSKGLLKDHLNVEISGPCVVLGITSLSLKYAFQVNEIDPREGVQLNAFIISDEVDAVTRITHDGQRAKYDEASHKADIERQLGIGEGEGLH